MTLYLENTMTLDLKPGKSFHFTVDPAFEGERLDTWLSTLLSDEISRNKIQKWIDSGTITGPHKKIKGSLKIKEGETYEILVPPPVEPDLTPVFMDIPILFEDDYLAVIHKPPGISVHPGPGENKRTLINGLLHIWKDLPASEGYRPGIVHRLDSPTEGLMLIAKTENSHRKLAELFSTRNIEKKYLAWLLAHPPNLEGTVDLPIRRHKIERKKMTVDQSGRPARTDYRVIESIISRKGRKFTLVDLLIHTGRTHQIRVHMAHIGCPVVGDPLYSKSSERYKRFGMLLLARSLAFTHPFSGKELRFELEIPPRFDEFRKICENY